MVTYGNLLKMLYNLESDIDVQKFDFRINQLKEKNAKVELKEKRLKRTLNQNSYLHVCISIFAIEIGNTLEEMKTDLKRECSFMMYEKNRNKYLRSSSDLNTKEMTDWIEWIKNKAGVNSIFIPSADDYQRNWVEIEKEIQSHKQYL